MTGCHKHSRTMAPIPNIAIPRRFGVEVRTMFGAGVPPVSPIPSVGDGSWVWALVVIAVVLGALAATWWARLWGRASDASRDHPEVASDERRKAA